MEDCQNISQNSLKRKPEGAEEDLDDLKRPLGEVEIKVLPKVDEKVEEGKIEGEKCEGLGDGVKVQASGDKDTEITEVEEGSKQTVESKLESSDDKKIQLEDTNKDVGGIKECEENGEEKGKEAVNIEVVQGENPKEEAKDGKVEENIAGEVKNNEKP